MPLSPIDVQQKTFRVALRGYAEDEVDEFLDEVVVSIREYEQRIEELSYQVGSLEAQLVENRQTEEAMRRTLLLAERTADEITEEARREAERIRSEARTEAKALSAEQSRERESLIEELHRLREIVTDVRERLTDVAGQTLDRLRPLVSDINDTLDQVEGSDASIEADDFDYEEPAPPAWAAAATADDVDDRPGSHQPDDSDQLDEGSVWAAEDDLDDADADDIDYWTSSTPRRSRWADGDTAEPSVDAASEEDEAAGESAVHEPVGGPSDDLGGYEDADDDEPGDERYGDDGSDDDAHGDDAHGDGAESGTRRRPWERFGD